jgi:hypothetical protein
VLASQAAVERYAYAESLSWLDLAAGAARGADQVAEANRRTAEVLELAGWREAPPGLRPGGPATREIVKDDMDLTVPG